MRLEFHRQIASDISQIMDYYEDVAGPQLSYEFYSELRVFFQKAADFPEVRLYTDLASHTPEVLQRSISE